MAQGEMYREQIIIEVTGDEAATARITAMDRYLQQVKKRADILARAKISPTANLVDKATRTIKTIETGLGKLSGVRNITVGIADKASGAVKGIIRKITSPLALLGGGAGLAGLGKLTLGAAAEWEVKAVSMEHWLKGNAQAAQQFTAWLDRLADLTPFEMSDIFPAASRAVGITNGDVGMAQRLVKLATDMAGLTPGKTVRDAMEALADAQMGEYERLKEFSVKMTMTEAKKIGGFAGFLRFMEGRFAGGAEKLGRTAIGKLSTVTDNIKKLFRKAGTGMLDGITPGLDRVLKGVVQNEPALKRLQGQFESVGRSLGKWVLTRFESAYTWIQKLAASDGAFRTLSFGGKLIYLLDQGLDAVLKWMDGPGGKKSERVFAKVGTIAAKAWSHALTGSVKATARSIGAGDIVGAALGILAFSKLGGVKLLKGGLTAGKWLAGLLRGGKAAAAAAGAAKVAGSAAASTGGAIAAGTAAAGVTGVKILYGPAGQVLSAVAPAAGTAAVAKGVSALSKAGRLAGKLAWPVAIGAEALTVAMSRDKVKAAAQGAAGLAGMWGGAKLGTAIGTAIAPGIGSAIGAAIGGVGGYFAARYAAGHAIDAFRGKSTSSTANYAGAVTAVIPDVTVNNQIRVNVSITNTRTSIDTERIADEVADKVAAKLAKRIGQIFENSVGGAYAAG